MPKLFLQAPKPSFFQKAPVTIYTFRMSETASGISHTWKDFVEASRIILVDFFGFFDHLQPICSWKTQRTSTWNVRQCRWMPGRTSSSIFSSSASWTQREKIVFQASILRCFREILQHPETHVVNMKRFNGNSNSWPSKSAGKIRQQSSKYRCDCRHPILNPWDTALSTQDPQKWPWFRKAVRMILHWIKSCWSSANSKYLSNIHFISKSLIHPWRRKCGKRNEKHNSQASLRKQMQCNAKHLGPALQIWGYRYSLTSSPSRFDTCVKLMADGWCTNAEIQ